MKEQHSPCIAQDIAEKEQSSTLALTAWLLKSITAITTIHLIFKEGGDMAFGSMNIELHL